MISRYYTKKKQDETFLIIISFSRVFSVIFACVIIVLNTKCHSQHSHTNNRDYDNMVRYLILIVLTVFIVCKLYVKLSTGWCKSATCLIGKTVLITGATSGIGYETALDLAKRGARIILGSINEEQGEEAKLKIISETGNKNVIVKVADFSSFDSVRALAKDIAVNEDRLDILINNAGATGIGNRRTSDDCLYLMQVNYFSSFLLTNLLIDLLKKTKGSRIVNVSSLVANYASKLDLAKLNEYPGHFNTVYSRSKLCLLLFTIELAKKLNRTSVTTYSLHPGVVKSNIFKNVHGLEKFIVLLGYSNFKTCEEGAQTTIHCAVTKGIEKDNGEHFVDCKKVSRYKTARDMELCEHLWNVTKEIVHLKPDENHL